MTSINKEVERVIDGLYELGALDHLIIVGSWSLEFYKLYFSDKDFHASVRTTDIDFLIPKKPNLECKIDVPAFLGSLGFEPDFSEDGWITYKSVDYEVQFLLPRKGTSETPVKIEALSVNARPLPHMWLLTEHTIPLKMKGRRLTLPHPAGFALHKLIVSTRRREAHKKAKDKEQAITVLAFLKDQEDLDILKELYVRLSKNEKRVVDRIVREDPLLKEIFSKIRN